MGGRSFFHFLVKWGGHYKMLWGVKNFKNCKVTPPTIKHKRVGIAVSVVFLCSVIPQFSAILAVSRFQYKMRLFYRDNNPFLYLSIQLATVCQ